MATVTDNRLLPNYPIRIEWDGWVTDTFQLLKHGWSFVLRRNILNLSNSLVIRHRQKPIYAETNEISDTAIASQPSVYVAEQRLKFTVKAIYSNVKVTLHKYPKDERWITRGQDIERLGLFPPLAEGTQQIVLPEPTVSELLQKITDMQQKNKIDSTLRPELRAQILGI